MDKSTALRAFNTLFFDFVNDVIGIFPGSRELVMAKTSFETMRSFNTSIIVKCWYKNVFSPYSDKILAGDWAFFIDKDYRSDLDALGNADELIGTIDKFRDKIRDMSPENQATSLDYLKKLCILSEIYYLGSEEALKAWMNL
jgi:hypothetical protein